MSLNEQESEEFHYRAQRLSSTKKSYIIKRVGVSKKRYSYGFLASVVKQSAGYYDGPRVQGL